MRAIMLLVAATSLLLVAADWPQFRGPNATATFEGTDSGPISWSPTKGIVWKTALPGAGASSPVTFGDQIFVTCYSGYGQDEDEPGEPADIRYHLVSLSPDGKILWIRGIKSIPQEVNYKGFITLHGYASTTPAVDSTGVYTFFGDSGVYAVGLDGKPLWKASVGTGTHNWGCGTSPLLYENLVILNASVESGSIVALDKATGKEVWRFEGIERSWSTPALVETRDGDVELAVSMKGKVLGLDPTSGKQLWQCESVDDYICPSVVAHEGTVYVTGGRKPLTIAVLSGGRGDVTNTHRLWLTKETPKVGTPVYHDGYLYWISHRGVAMCVRAIDGEIIWEESIELEGSGDKIYASVVLVGSTLYGVTREDGTVVLDAAPEFNEVGRNRLDDKSIFNATPAVKNGRLLVRSDQFLYCLGQ